MIRFYFLISVFLASWKLQGQANITLVDSSGASAIQVILLQGVIDLKADQEASPIYDSGYVKVYTIPSKYPVHYARIIRNGKAFFIPITKGKHTYVFLNKTDNEYITTNQFDVTYKELTLTVNTFLRPYRDSLNRIDKQVEIMLPSFIDSLKNMIKDHPYEKELDYTFIKSFHYHLQKKFISKRKQKAWNERALAEIDVSTKVFECWGYNEYLNKLLKDYYSFHMNMFNYPFRTFKPESLVKFVFEEELFKNADLNNFLAFYKIKNLESSNDKNRLFLLADSLQKITRNAALKEEIGIYLQSAENRVRPMAKAPDFFLKEVGKNKFYRLEDFQEKILVLDFWATWCGPCVKSFNTVEQLSKEHADSVVFVSISQDANEKKVLDFLRKNPSYTWTFLFDGQNGATGIVYEAAYIPKYVIIDRQGILRLETNKVKEVEKWLNNRVR